MRKLRTLKQVMPKGAMHDSVSKRRKTPDRMDPDLVTRCQNAWNSKEDLRVNRKRVLDYVYGDQWGEVITYHGEQITERKYIQMKGNVPLVNNIMISILSSVVGLYAKQGTEPACFARQYDARDLSDMMSATLQASWQDTKMQDVLKLAFEDYICGGFCMMRETYEERDGLKDAWTDYINPNYCFWESGSDVRFTDLRLIGVLHDVAPGTLINKFCNAKYGWSVKDIMDVFGIAEDYTVSNNLQQNEQYDLHNISFITASNPSMCRLIEVWTKETKTRYQCYDPVATNADDAEFRIELEDIDKIHAENAVRRMQYEEAGVPEEERAYITYEMMIDEFWYYTYLAPDGTIIASGETPYEHKSHPFTLRLYTYVNAEVHPFMGNIIDQQRYINRLIIMHDIAARSAAKGLTIFPEESIPEGMTKADIAEEITEYDGLLFFSTNRMNPNLRPEIITSNAVQIGTTELLQLQMGLAREITNVTGALQGKTPSAGTSASRYAMEAQNATTSLYSLLKDFSSFTESIADKKCQVIAQFYPEGRIVLAKNGIDTFSYDRLSARDVKFRTVIKEAAAQQTFINNINDTALRLLELGAISVKQYLSSVNLPFAQSLLQDVVENEQMQQEMAAAQQMLQPNSNNEQNQ